MMEVITSYLNKGFHKSIFLKKKKQETLKSPTKPVIFWNLEKSLHGKNKAENV